MVQFSGGNGSSIDEAVVIHADNDIEGVDAEYEYIEGLCGMRDVDYICLQQELIQQNDENIFDLITIELKNGKIRKFYFDIHQFFGH